MHWTGDASAPQHLRPLNGFCLRGKPTLVFGISITWSSFIYLTSSPSTASLGPSTSAETNSLLFTEHTIQSPGFPTCSAWTNVHQLLTWFTLSHHSGYWSNITSSVRHLLITLFRKQLSSTSHPWRLSTLLITTLLNFYSLVMYHSLFKFHEWRIFICSVQGCYLQGQQ